MPIEIEAKLRVDSLTRTAKKLNALGAKFLKALVQRDYYLDDAKTGLTRTDRCLRLREEFTAKTRRAVLAYKGARQKGRFKKRLEVQTEISDAKSVRKMLASIGYAEMLVYEKKRQLWVYGGCEICLDELPLLGKYVEIESSSVRRIAKVQKSLGLSDLPHIRESYAALMERELRRLGRKKMKVFLKGPANG